MFKDKHLINIVRRNLFFITKLRVTTKFEPADFRSGIESAILHKKICIYHTRVIDVEFIANGFCRLVLLVCKKKKKNE